ncbi:polysaccharide biosynthesis/export family protein [Geojedonia litorea]|uniref:Polysaccharide biosynthesis/export family protein n=1 Tax=Geojedonia litorea TaxID=1268269 RepID=A0ABV9N030_9FLAO
MKYPLLVIGVLLCSFFTSCIPYKDTLYYQQKGTAIDSTQVLQQIQQPYRVQINDILSIRIKVLDQDNVAIFNPIGDSGDLNATSAENAYMNGFTVDLHGNIRIPVLGELQVLGYTTVEIQSKVEALLLKEQFKETARIFVTVKLAGLRYTTSGEINNTGTQTLYQERVNIFEALANSGDIPVTGDKKDVLLIRQYPQGQEIHHLDLTDIAIMQSPYYYIQPNDMIYVKPLKQKALGTGTTVLENITRIASVLTLLTSIILIAKR